METAKNQSKSKIPWNKGKIVGQKPALKLTEIWGIRIQLQLEIIFESLMVGKVCF